MQSYAIDIAGLNLFFGKKQVLKGVNIRIPAVQATALIGPSGCGKSTLLRVLNRMHDFSPDARVEGLVRIDNQDIYSPKILVNDLRRKVGMVFQKPNPFPKSIFENIAYGLRLNGYPKSEIADRVTEALHKSYLFEEVRDKLNEPANSLSGGQQQRLCIARAIAINPEIILMDEPCSALDPISTGKIEELILELKQRYTILIVTHNMQQAQRVSDYTAFMYLGELIEFGPTEMIFGQPAQTLTRDYVRGHFG